MRDLEQHNNNAKQTYLKKANPGIGWSVALQAKLAGVDQMVLRTHSVNKLFIFLVFVNQIFLCKKIHREKC